MSKFKKKDPVRNLGGNEGIVTEVFISFPTFTGTNILANWLAPEIHYLVTFGVNCTELYAEKDLTDIRQGELDLGLTITDWGIAASEEDYWSKWYV